MIHEGHSDALAVFLRNARAARRGVPRAAYLRFQRVDDCSGLVALKQKSRGQTALVKLTRVMLLGPVVVGFALAFRRERAAVGGVAAARGKLSTYVPWFVGYSRGSSSAQDVS